MPLCSIARAPGRHAHSLLSLAAIRDALEIRSGQSPAVATMSSKGLVPLSGVIMPVCLIKGKMLMPRSRPYLYHRAQQGEDGRVRPARIIQPGPVASVQTVLPSQFRRGRDFGCMAAKKKVGRIQLNDSHEWLPCPRVEWEGQTRTVVPDQHAITPKQ